MSLFIGLDVGTQSVKLIAYDPQARRIVATHGQALELIAGNDGSREQHAQWWIDAIRTCFGKLDAVSVISIWYCGPINAVSPSFSIPVNTVGPT